MYQMKIFISLLIWEIPALPTPDQLIQGIVYLEHLPLLQTRLLNRFTLGFGTEDSTVKVDICADWMEEERTRPVKGGIRSEPTSQIAHRRHRHGICWVPLIRGCSLRHSTSAAFSPSILAGVPRLFADRGNCSAVFGASMLRAPVEALVVFRGATRGAYDGPGATRAGYRSRNEALYERHRVVQVEGEQRLSLLILLLGFLGILTPYAQNKFVHYADKAKPIIISYLRSLYYRRT
jgi:hypothetical protein